MEEIYKKLAIEFNLPYKVIRRVCRSPFRTMLRAVQSGLFRSVRLQGLGIFYPASIRREEKAEQPKKEKGGETVLTTLKI